jgi:hypothetical protein
MSAPPLGTQLEGRADEHCLRRIAIVPMPPSGRSKAIAGPDLPALFGPRRPSLSAGLRRQVG